MLQQTQVATATPYYHRFLERFPDLPALAGAPLEDVLARWAGLGYYRRARLLHAAAQAVVREHGGRVPADPGAFAALPGIGRYTQGAVLSIGFGASLPVLDGNVARVFARWTARPLQVRRPADARLLWAMAESLVPPAAAATSARSPGDWNQALMELGATVCTPRAPRCPDCPVRGQCRAFALGTPEAFPPAAARRDAERVRRVAAWIEKDGRVLLARRSGALLDGLWEPPGADVPDGASARVALRAVLRAHGLRGAIADSGVRVKHTITHRAIEIEVWTVRPAVAPPRRATLRWLAPGSRALAQSAASRKIAAAMRARRA